MTVARNIVTPISYPPGTPDDFIRAFEELTQAANGGVEGTDVITNVDAQLNDPASILNKWVNRLDSNGQTTVILGLSDAGILAIINTVPPVADQLVYFVDSATAAGTSLTAFARTLIAAATAGAAATVLGLGTGNAVTFLTAEVGVGGLLVSGTKVVGAQEAAIASLTDSTTGTADGTLDAIGDTSTSNEGGAINNNFADVNAKLDAILAILRPTGHGLIAT